jgi:adenosylhomocysteine nucleosidase
MAAAGHASSADLVARFGPVVTVGAMCITVADKLVMAARFPGAIAMDMESAGAARVAESAGVPWLAVRAITDGVSDPFPLPFDRYVGVTGEPNRARIALAALAHPRSIPGVWRLGQRSARAAGNLAVFVEATVRAMRGETR